MPVHGTIDRDARVVLTTASGVVTKEEFIAHIEKTWRDESVTSFDELLDATQADASQLTAEDLAAIVNSGVVYDPASHPRLALCVSSELAYGIGRMFGMMRESNTRNSREINVFRDLDEARAWLAEAREDRG